MATRRRDIAPRKDKTGNGHESPSSTPNRAIPTSNAPPKITNSTLIHDHPKKHITASLRPAVRSSANDVHKQLVKKQTSLDSTHKPTHAKRTLDKNPLPAKKTRIPTNPSHETTPLSTQKTRVSTAPSLTSRVKTPLPTQRTQVSTNKSLQFRDKTSVLTNPSLRPHDKTSLQARKTQASPGPISGKTIASEKTVLGKNSKILNKDDGRCSLPETPKSTTLKMSSACCEQETDINTASTKKEQTNYTFQENDENLNIYPDLPEVDTLLEDQELDTFFLQQELQTLENVEHEEHIMKVESDGEKGITDLAAVGDQVKPLDIVEIEAEIHDDDGAKIVTMIEPSPAPLDVKTQELEEKLFVKKNLDEHSAQEIVDSTYTINKSVANDYHKEEDGEKKVEVVVEVIEKVFDKKDEVSGQSEVHESGETKEPEVVEKHNQELENKAPKKPEVVEKHNQESENKAPKRGGAIWKDSVVSNNAIKETTSKLRDQRISRVRALAGAFESVMQ